MIKVIPDAPSKIDLLGHSSYVNALFRIIESESTVTPFNIGILGEWGTGKSTLMMQLASRLSNSQFPVVIFNPWKYDDKEEIVHALIQTILFSFDKQEKRKEVKDIVISIAKGLGQMVLSKIIAAKTLDVVDFDKLVEIYTEKKEENIKFINEFESVFTELVSKYADDKKLVIFIDDLDRCLPESIIKILESIKLFLSVPKCVFIIGIDNVVIQEAIAEKYGKNYSFSGKDYLEKIVQLSFSIPNPSEQNIEAYTYKICGQLLETKIIKLIVSGCDANPRRIKRYINSFNLIEAVIDEELKNQTRKIDLNKNILSFVLLLQIQFANIYDYYQDNLKDCSTLFEMLNQNKYFDTEELDRLKSINPIYFSIIDNDKFLNFVRKASILGVELLLGDEGLSEYFSATKSIATGNEAVENYYLPEIVEKKGVLMSVTRDLYLIDSGPNKLAVVKLVKDMTGQGLKESKDLVDFSLGTPSLLLRNVPKEQQKELTMRFVQSGAIIEFR